MFYQSRNKVSKYWIICLLIPVKCVLESCDGRFLRSFKLPEETWMDNFKYENGKVYYLTTGNSIMPDLYCYDVQAARMDTLCRRDRKMGTKGYMGQSFIYVLDGNMYTYHYLMIRCTTWMETGLNLHGFFGQVK